jgi:hypothetical protein
MFPKGRFVNIDPQNPDAVARCDRSGQLCMHANLVKQMQYRGEGLIWDGLWVNKHFLDVPNPQGLNPVIMPDPIPVQNPRPWQKPHEVWSNQYIPWEDNPQPDWAGWGDWRGQK